MKRPFINPALIVATGSIIILAVINVITYDRIVGRERALSEQKRTLEAARAENTELKKQWYQTLDEKNITTFAQEYGFIKIISPGYLPS